MQDYIDPNPPPCGDGCCGDCICPTYRWLDICRPEYSTQFLDYEENECVEWRLLWGSGAK